MFASGGAGRDGVGQGRMGRDGTSGGAWRDKRQAGAGEEGRGGAGQAAGGQGRDERWARRDDAIKRCKAEAGQHSCCPASAFAIFSMASMFFPLRQYLLT